MVVNGISFGVMTPIADDKLIHSAIYKTGSKMAAAVHPPLVVPMHYDPSFKGDVRLSFVYLTLTEGYTLLIILSVPYDKWLINFAIVIFCL